MDTDARQLIELLDLRPHPEGGYFRETYRSSRTIPPDALPPEYGAARSFSAAIYYMLVPGSASMLHRLKSDEIFHFYLGDAVMMLQLHPDGHAETMTLGQNVVAAERPQVVVPAGVWQGSFLNEGGRFALMGCTVAPGFDFDDFELGARVRLLDRYPDQAELIERLTTKSD